MPANDQQHAAEPPHQQCCVNCGVAGLPTSCYRRHPLHGDYCCACYTYSSTHGGRARPEQLWQRQRHRMLEALDPNALRCTHCGRLPKEGELFHKCRHPRNGRPLCGTCHHYAWRKDGLMRPWELVARDPHMRDASGRPAQQAFHSGRPGTGAAAPVATSAAAAGREQEEAAAAAGGGGHRARRGRPVREMSEAEQAAWHAGWQLPSGYLPADAVPQERRAGGRRQADGGAAADEQQEQGRRQQWQQLVAWDGEGEAGQQPAQQQQQQVTQHVRPEDWEAPLHGDRWEGPGLPAAGRRQQPAGAEAGADGQQQQQHPEAQQQQHAQQTQQLEQQQQTQQQQQQPVAGAPPQLPQPPQQVQRPAARPRPPQRAQQQPEVPAAQRRPAVRAPVALASLGLEEADLFGAATAAREQPSPQQAQRVTVRRAEPVKPPSRSEMQALLQREREAEWRRVEQQLRAEAERTWQQQRLAGVYSLPAQRAEGAAHGRHSTAARPSESGGSCDTWRAAVRGNGLQGGVEDWGEAADDWWDEEEAEVQQLEEEQQQMGQQQEQQQQGQQQERQQQGQQQAEQKQQPQGQWRQQQRQRQRRRRRKRQRQWQEEEEEPEAGEDGSSEGSGPQQSLTHALFTIVRGLTSQQVNSALEADLWKGNTPELQPLTAHVRKQLAEGRHRYVGRTLCISGIPSLGLSELSYEAQQRLLETELTAALNARPQSIEAVHLFREEGSATWEADVRFARAQDTARVLRFNLGMQLQGSSLTLQPDSDEVTHERDLLWRAKRMQLVLEQVAELRRR